MKKYAKIPLMQEVIKHLKNMTKIATLFVSSAFLLTACGTTEPEPDLLQQNKKNQEILEAEKLQKKQEAKALFAREHEKTFNGCFDTGRVVVNKKCFKDIATFLNSSKKADKQRIIVEVHTDKAGKKALNLDISKKRAYGVAKRIYTFESKNSNVYYKGFGEAYPLVDKETAEANRINRRIKITLKDKNYALNTKVFKKYVVSQSKKAPFLKANKQKVEVKRVDFKEMNIDEIVNSPKKQTSRFQLLKKANLVLKSKKLKQKELQVKRIPRKYQVFQKYTGEADIGWIYFGKKELQDKFYLTCREDSPVEMRHKDIASSKKSEFMKGVYSKRISGEYAKDYMELYPVYIYENGMLPFKNPLLTLYDDSRGIKRYQTTVNAYRGTKGILYRVFVNGNKKIKCLDLVISYGSKDITYGRVYTKEVSREGIEVKSYKFLPEQ